MDLNLVYYILAQVSKGYSLEQVVEYLKKLNYNEQYIEYSVGYIRKNYPAYAAQRPQQQQYIETPQSNSQNEQDAFQEKKKQPGFRSSIVISYVIVIFLVVFSAAFYFTMQKNEPAALFDIDTVIIESNIYQGQTISYNVELNSQLSASPVDIELEISVKDNIGKVVFSELKTMAVSIQSSKKFELKLPEDMKPSSYTLEIAANYNKQQAISRNVFFVKEKPGETAVEIIQEIKKSGFNASVIELFEKPITSLTYDEMVVRIKSLSLIEPDIAEKQCQLLKNHRQECILEVAKSSENINYCGLLTQQNYKDQCYFYFIRLGSTDRSLCERFIEQSLQKACRDIIYNNELRQAEQSLG